MVNDFPQYFARLFIDTCSGVHEKRLILQELSETRGRLEFDLCEYDAIENLRFNPLNTMVVLRLEHIKIITARHTLDNKIPYTTNALGQQENLLIFEMNEPMIYINMKNVHTPKTLVIHLEYIAWGDEVYRYIGKETSSLIKCKDEKISQQQQTIQEQERILQQQTRQIYRQVQIIRQQKQKIQAVENTLSWKITEPLRKADRFFGIQALPLSKAFLQIVKRLLKDADSLSPFPDMITSPKSGPLRTTNAEIAKLRQTILLNRKIYLSTNHVKRNKVALYTNSLGNYFFHEITELIAEGFRELEFEVELRDELDGFTNNADWHFIIAPHEFFYIGDGKPLQKKKWPPNTILINTEQPGTSWFTLAYKCFPKVYAIWDINYQSSLRLADICGFSYYLPPGYVPEFRPFHEVKELPYNNNTCFLETEISKRSYFHQPLSNRPIDIFFIAHASERRRAFLAKHASFLSKYRCYLHIPNLTNPVIPGKTTDMDTETVVGLEQRSKIILNIHHGQDVYFEWHRIVMHGIWQKTLVISEPCSPAPPFEPNVDFVVAELDDIPEKIEYYLSSESGQKDAQIMTEHAFKTLTEKCKIIDFLTPLLSSLYLLDREKKGACAFKRVVNE